MEEQELVKNDIDYDVLISGAQRILRLENEIKGLKDDISQVKKDIKDAGAKPSDVTKSLTIIKREMKKRQNPELREIELIAEKIMEDEEVIGLTEKLLEKVN